MRLIARRVVIESRFLQLRNPTNPRICGRCPKFRNRPNWPCLRRALTRMMPPLEPQVTITRRGEDKVEEYRHQRTALHDQGDSPYRAAVLPD